MTITAIQINWDGHPNIVLMESQNFNNPAMTSLQIEIFDSLLSMTWEQVMNRYGIKSKRVMQTIIKRTALGFNWYPGHPGGNLPYLNSEKENRLLHFIEIASEHQECLYSSEVIYLAYAMRKESCYPTHQRCFGIINMVFGLF